MMEERNREENRRFEALCVGLALGNVVVRPVPERFERGDTVQVEEIAMICGGDAYNQASVLSALGHRTALLSKVAKDTSGKLVLDTMTARGVDTSLVTFDREAGTSVCVVMVRPDGSRNFCTYKGCLRTFGMGDIDFQAVTEVRLVSIGGLFALPAFDREASIRLFREARRAGTITVADTKHDAFGIGLKGIQNLLEYTDYFFPSYEEAASLSGLERPEEMAAFFADKGAAHVGIKLGGDGCYVRTEGFAGKIPAFSCPVLDTTGAGDNFMAGLIHGILEGWDIRDSVRYANAAGALAVTRLGATSDGPYAGPIREILSQSEAGKRLIKEVLEG